MSLNEQEIEALLDSDFHALAADRLAEYQDFLKCPECEQPSFFPYGDATHDTEDLRQVPRWLCKQCGYYIGPEGEQWALYDPVVDLTDTPLKTWGCWQLTQDCSPYAYLPSERLAEHNSTVRKQAGLE